MQTQGLSRTVEPVQSTPPHIPHLGTAAPPAGRVVVEVVVLDAVVVVLETVVVVATELVRVVVAVVEEVRTAVVVELLLELVVTGVPGPRAFALLT